MGILGKTKLLILRKLREEPSHGYRIAKQIGISLSSAYEHLKGLKAMGLIEVSSDGRRKVFTLTEKGSMLLSLVS